MSPQYQSHITKYKHGLQMLSVFLVAGGTGAYLTHQNLVDPVLFWGGSKCKTIGETVGCFGYPPSGILALLLCSWLAHAGLAAGFDKGREVLHS